MNVPRGLSKPRDLTWIQGWDFELLLKGKLPCSFLKEKRFGCIPAVALFLCTYQKEANAPAIGKLPQKGTCGKHFCLTSCNYVIFLLIKEWLLFAQLSFLTPCLLSARNPSWGGVIRTVPFPGGNKKSSGEIPERNEKNHMNFQGKKNKPAIYRPIFYDTPPTLGSWTPPFQSYMRDLA